MTSEFRYELLAKAMVGRYRLGYVQVAMLLACNLFEAIINQKLKKYDKEKIWADINNLDAKIKRLAELPDAIKGDSLYARHLRTLFKHYRNSPDRDEPYQMSRVSKTREIHVIERLRNLKWLRNNIMHDSFNKVISSNDDIIDDMVNYVWSELAPGNFSLFLTKWENNERVGRLVDTIEKHTADYMVRAIDEVDALSIDDMKPAATADWVIKGSDFSNLFTIRDKLVGLKIYLNKWLKDTGQQLHTNTLTTIDTTSAYIWMPLTSVDNQAQMGICASPVSILATPVDIRFYMDFGGMAVNLRRKYYDFLKSGNYTDAAVQNLHKKSFFVFDTEWFSFVVKKRTLCMWLTDYKDTDIEAAYKEIADYYESSDQQITWNRMLHGYIFDREYFEKHASLGLDVIQNCLIDIIAFHNAFNTFRKQEMTDAL